jgi:hypothetical protein
MRALTIKLDLPDSACCNHQPQGTRIARGNKMAHNQCWSIANSVGEGAVARLPNRQQNVHDAKAQCSGDSISPSPDVESLLPNVPAGLTC